jgi:hypothetical protein
LFALGVKFRGQQQRSWTKQLGDSAMTRDH